MRATPGAEGVEELSSEMAVVDTSKVASEWRRAMAGIDASLVPDPIWDFGGGKGRESGGRGLSLRGGGRVEADGVRVRDGDRRKGLGKRGAAESVETGRCAVGLALGECVKAPVAVGLRLRGGRLLEDWMKKWNVDQAQLDAIDGGDERSDDDTGVRFL